MVTRRSQNVVEFSFDHRDEVVGFMAGMAAAGDGWINLLPNVDPDDVPPESTFRVFSVRGPSVPLCTWKPADLTARSAPCVSIGVQHGAGVKVVPKLAEIDVVVPREWRVLQDQPRRGLVIAVPTSEDHDRVLEWLLRAGHALCPLPYEEWRATIYGPR